MAKSPGDQGHQNQIDLVVVVNGAPVEIEANTNAPLSSAVQQALAKSENAGQPIENWEVKDEAGKLLDISKKIGELGLVSGLKIFVSLKAGVTG
jgi:hypothetical protein